MADNFTQATILPSIPLDIWEGIKKDPKFSRYFSEDSDLGLDSENVHGEGVYLFSENGVNNNAVVALLQELLRLCPEIESFEIEGAFTYSKMRPGEFGGFCCLVGRGFEKWGATGTLLDTFKEEYRRRIIE